MNNKEDKDKYVNWTSETNDDLVPEVETSTNDYGVDIADGIGALPRPMVDMLLDEANGKERRSYPPRHMYVTELTSCARKAYFKRTLGRPDYDLESAWFFYRGNVFDDIFNRVMDVSQKRVTHTLIVDGDRIRISGYYDFRDEDGIINDLKTSKSLYYRRKNASPSKNHVMQVAFYGFCEAEDKVRLLYVDISGGDVLRFTVPVDDNTDKLATLERRARGLYKALKNHDPLLAPKGDEWVCKYCDYQNECDAAEGDNDD